MRMVLRRLSLAVIMFTAAASLARASFVTVVRNPQGALQRTPRRSCFGATSGRCCFSPCAVQRVPASMSASRRVNSSRRQRWWQSSAASLVTASSTKTTSSSTARFLSGSGSGSAASDAASSVVDTCQRKIRDALNAVEVKVTGAYDDPNGSHVSIEVVSSVFEGKRPVQRQQLVYKAIWEELQGPVHAVDSMVCKTPAEASAA